MEDWRRSWGRPRHTLSNDHTSRKCQIESELDIPFKVVADFMARAWRLVGGCRVCLNGEGGWNLPLCKEFQASSILLNDRSFCPTPNPTNLEPIVPWMHLCQIYHHGLSHHDRLVYMPLVLWLLCARRQICWWICLPPSITISKCIINPSEFYAQTITSATSHRFILCVWVRSSIRCSN